MKTKLLAGLLTATFALSMAPARSDDDDHIVIDPNDRNWNRDSGFYVEKPVRVYRYKSDDEWDYYRPNYYYRERRTNREPRTTVEFNFGR